MPRTPIGTWRRRARSALFAAAALGVVALATTRPARALLLGQRGLRPVGDPARVLFEEGAGPQAFRVTEILPAVTESVEAALGAPFSEPATILVFASQESFNSRAGVAAGGRATGAVFLGRVLIGPRAFETGTARNVLAHELTHAHLRQTVGVIASVLRVPRWFQEGLAVHVARRLGPDPFEVSESEAVAALLAGQAFVPEPAGRWWRPRGAADHGLSVPMFYRQAELFVRYLAGRDPRAFADLLEHLRNGSDLNIAEVEYGAGLQGLWREFLAGLPAAR